MRRRHADARKMMHVILWSGSSGLSLTGRLSVLALSYLLNNPFYQEYSRQLTNGNVGLEQDNIHFHTIASLTMCLSSWVSWCQVTMLWEVRGHSSIDSSDRLQPQRAWLVSNWQIIASPAGRTAWGIRRELYKMCPVIKLSRYSRINEPQVPIGR